MKYDGLMDTVDLLELKPDGKTEAAMLTIMFVIAQQATAQIAAIRELLEAEQGRLTAQRRREAGWPPRGSEPLSHIS